MIHFRVFLGVTSISTAAVFDTALLLGLAGAAMLLAGLCIAIWVSYPSRKDGAGGPE